MSQEDRIIELEKKNAVLDFQVQELRESLKAIKVVFETINSMLQQIKENPFGLNS